VAPRRSRDAGRSRPGGRDRGRVELPDHWVGSSRHRGPAGPCRDDSQLAMRRGRAATGRVAPRSRPIGDGGHRRAHSDRRRQSRSGAAPRRPRAAADPRDRATHPRHVRPGQGRRPGQGAPSMIRLPASQSVSRPPIRRPAPAARRVRHRCCRRSARPSRALLDGRTRPVDDLAAADRRRATSASSRTTTSSSPTISEISPPRTSPTKATSEWVSAASAPAAAPRAVPPGPAVRPGEVTAVEVAVAAARAAAPTAATPSPDVESRARRSTAMDAVRSCGRTGPLSRPARGTGWTDSGTTHRQRRVPRSSDHRREHRRRPRQCPDRRARPDDAAAPGDPATGHPGPAATLGGSSRRARRG